MPSTLFQPGRTVWRVEPCRRAAVLIDGAAVFAAMREAFLAARHSIFVVGWDIDSRTELQGENPPTDGLPTTFGPFIVELVKRRPNLAVHLLLWDYSLLYVHEREKLPRLSLDLQMPPQVNFCLDSAVPFGSSQHQKLVIVDDTLAFSGGLDITIRRWDTARHDPDTPDRIDPAGAPYEPFHDVQMMVDGKAAEALALLAHRRWHDATYGEPAVTPEGDPWPSSVTPDFTDVPIGIARTEPRYRDRREVHEAEALFLNSIDRAERTIYIENQFITAPRIAKRLARRLRRRPDLEVVIVAPRAHESLIERRTMRNGRIRFWRILQEAGGPRVRLVSPTIEKDGRAIATMIHSKVMVIDDSFLRIGSANLNNRSMGADTECDLAIEATNPRQRKAIVGLRNRLLGEHCGTTREEVAAALSADPSLVALTDTMSRNGRRLTRIDDGRPDRNVLARLVERIADPRRPLKLARVLAVLLPRPERIAEQREQKTRRGGASGRVLLAVGLLAALTVGWQYADLGNLADPDRMLELLGSFAHGVWAPLVVVAAFVLGAAVCFPVVVLILATAALFGPALGLAYATLGIAASAAATYGAGARFGRDSLARLGGERWNRLQDHLQRRGLLAVVAVRVLPVAPFTLVNLAAGASGIRATDFALGSLIGMGPGVVALCFLGSRLTALLMEPNGTEIVLITLVAGAWIGVSVIAQALVTRLTRTPT